MGLFDAFKQSAAESAGRVLRTSLENAKTKMASMSQRDTSHILAKFTEKREALIGRMNNMTPEGCTKTGMDLQRAGNKLKDTSPLEGYPLLLAGIWLESRTRPGSAATITHDFLEDVAVSMGGTPI